MKTETRSRRGWWKVAACVLLAAVLAAAGFFWYVSDYYRADEIALEVLAQDSGVTVQDDLTVLSPSYPTDTGLIFYPGAKVEGAAYLPLLDRLRQTGLTCVLVEMPFHLAIFDADAAEDVMEQFPDIQHWYTPWAGPWPPNSRRTTLTRSTALSCWGPTSTATTRPPTPSPSTAP